MEVWSWKILSPYEVGNDCEVDRCVERSSCQLIGASVPILIPELGRCFPNVPFECSVEAIQSIEANVKGDRNDLLVFGIVLDQEPLGLLDPVLVDELEEVLAEPLVDRLGKVVGGNLQLLCKGFE